jgi:phage gp36-like protein
VAYTSQNEIEKLIPPQHLNDALDDDRDGSADDDVLDQLIAVAANAVDAYLAGLYTVPFETPPAVVKEACLVFACEAVYARRLGLNEKNPFTDRADWWRKRLEKIGAGELPLDASQEKPNTPGAVVTEDVDVDSSLR